MFNKLMVLPDNSEEEPTPENKTATAKSTTDTNGNNLNSPQKTKGHKQNHIATKKNPNTNRFG